MNNRGDQPQAVLRATAGARLAEVTTVAAARIPLAGETPLVREPIPDPPDRPGLPRIRWSAGAEDALAAADQATQTAETSTPEVAR